MLRNRVWATFTFQSWTQTECPSSFPTKCHSNEGMLTAAEQLTSFLSSPSGQSVMKSLYLHITTQPYVPTQDCPK